MKKRNQLKKLFNGYRFCFSGFNLHKSNEWKEVIKRHGGKVDYLVNANTSFLINGDPTDEDSIKITSALNKDIPIVDMVYVQACIENLEVLPLNYDSDEMDMETAITTGKRAMKGIEDRPLKKKKIIDYKNARRTGKWRTARIFISSTFKDMHGERDYLTRIVFPELQERCRQLKVHLHPVDLRWGVTSDETDNALQLCLSEIDECRPFFIGMLGNRYGWRPDEYIVNDEPRFDWVKDIPRGKSITHLEMLYGAINDENASALLYFRDPNFIRDIPSDYMDSFIEEDQSKAYELEELKELLRSTPHCTLLENYPCQWKGIIDNKPMVGDLEEFGKHVVENMWEKIVDEFPPDDLTLTPVEIARSYHDRFIESHSQIFVGRKSLVQQILQYTYRPTTVPLVITGKPGSGKTSLVSYFARTFRETVNNDIGTKLITHFIGAEPGSTNIRNTLYRIIVEIIELFGFEDEIPNDFKEIQETFSRLLVKIGEISDIKFVLVLDALNQLDNTNNSHRLEWLPETIPENVKLILSTLQGDVANVLASRNTENLEVGPLSVDEQREIVTVKLQQYGKKLDENQMKNLLSKKESYKPLYLIVACEELRVFGVYEELGDRINIMADNVPELFEGVINRLTSDFDMHLVYKTLTYLTASRGGLLEIEILNLLGDGTTPVPMKLWTPLYRSLQSYLRPPGESGEGVLDFFHQQFPKAVKRMYFSEVATVRDIHSDLADYFQKAGDPDEDGRWAGENKRAYEFTPYHLVKSGNWENLEKCLCNLVFIEKKCSYGLAYDLVSDYLLFSHGDDSCLNSDSLTLKIMEYQRFVCQRIHILAKEPHLTFSMAYSLPDQSLPAQQANLLKHSLSEERPVLRWLHKPQVQNPNIMTMGVSMACRTCLYTHNGNILSGSDDGTLTLFDGNTGEEIFTLKGHSNSVMCVASNQEFIVSGSYDRSIIMWNIFSGEEYYKFSGIAQGVINTVDINLNNVIACGSNDNMVRIIRNNQIVQTINNYYQVMSVKFSPNGYQLATCDIEGNIKIYDFQSSEFQLKCQHVLTGDNNKQINSIEWNMSGTHVVTAGDDNLIRIFSVSGSISEEKVIYGHKDGVTHAVFSENGQNILSSSHDNVIYLWKRDGIAIRDKYGKKTKSVCQLIGHTGSVFRVGFSSDGNRIVSCSFDRTVKVWEINEHDSLEFSHEARILAVRFSPDKGYIATGSRDKTIKVWDVENGMLVAHLRGHASNVFDLCWAPNGKFIASAGRDNTVRIWETTSGNEVFCDKNTHKELVKCVAWSPDGMHLVSASSDKTIIIWNVSESGQLTIIGALYGHRGTINRLRYSHSGRRLASCSDDGTIKLWDTKLGKVSYGERYVKVATFALHSKSVHTVCFSPNDKYLASGAGDGLIIIWNARNSKPIKVIEAHSTTVREVSWTDDGRYIVSGSTDSFLKMWDSETYEVECSFASWSRLCSIDCCTRGFDVNIVCGDGSGMMYLLKPERLN
eukprot:TRINITY_DN12091_c0_g1_i1.p1 TRINITY_DN12091_c0_g1~~TRINITY_DN12091_c0_g1_i1.p1  ORF type:complete len:1481 (-),score=314.78 TRINITY_DN12091_c0_g1_i1:27-4469(-)